MCLFTLQGQQTLSVYVNKLDVELFVWFQQWQMGFIIGKYKHEKFLFLK